MFNNGRKTIGVILCDVSSHYQEQVCHTLSSYAQKKNYNVAYFTFYTCYGVDTRNGRGEANIIHLIPFEKLDAIVFCNDTIMNAGALNTLMEYLQKRATCPVVSIRRDTGVYPCVLINQKHSLEPIIHHLTDVHHMKRIAFMSGPLEHPDSIARLSDYKRALASREIPFDASLVFEGDFWREAAKSAAQYYTMELDEMPEAIVCANDYMATSLSNALIAEGFLVPDDIAVTGYDDIWEASISMPPITTISVPVEEMTKTAVKLIERMWKGETVEHTTYLEVSVKIRNSCGCQTFDMRSMLAKRVRQVNEHQNILQLVQSNTYMFVELSDIDDLKDIEKRVRLLDYSDNHVRNFFICLGAGKGEKYPKYRSARPGFAQKSKAVGAVMNRKTIKTELFDTNDLLPAEAQENKPVIYYFFPLHNNQYSYGYFAIAYDGLYGVDKTFQNWLAILGNALETALIKQKNQGLLKELNNLYIHDALTGLYNRRGFETMSETYYEKAKRDGVSYTIIALDMDNLKVINDCFGHMNGDLSLKTIGAAMEAASKTDDICARVGGDEFNVICNDYTEEDVKLFCKKFNDYLNEFNANSELPYLVRASVGYKMMQAGQYGRIEECVNMADAHLYQHKKEKKEKKEDGVIRPKE